LFCGLKKTEDWKIFNRFCKIGRFLINSAKLENILSVIVFHL